SSTPSPPLPALFPYTTLFRSFPLIAKAGIMLEGVSTFWGQFLPNLVATLVGAFVGFLLALRFDHARESRSRMEQEASLLGAAREDRKSTRLNSSHLGISYAVF